MLSIWVFLNSISLIFVAVTHGDLRKLHKSHQRNIQDLEFKLMDIKKEMSNISEYIITKDDKSSSID